MSRNFLDIKISIEGNGLCNNVYYSRGQQARWKPLVHGVQTRNWSLVVARIVARHWHQDGSPL